MSERPFVIRNLLNQKTMQHEERTLYFDAVYPGVYANGIQGEHGSCIMKGKTSQLLIDSVEFFVIRQLWPKCCAVSEQDALELVYPKQQEELF